MFVVTLNPPEETTDPRVTSVADGIENALAAAKADAGDRAVAIFGATTAQHCSASELIDEIVVHIPPVLLGEVVSSL